ncbi:hypothetical protein CPB86DRAFT_817280 [Serendipita vermifera]|nr:hypothetical protein CPB86DRAFT_817280 [Serendipita vermifera]
MLLELLESCFRSPVADPNLLMTPLLPFIDESHNHLSTSIMQTDDLFSEACDAYNECQKMEAPIKALRLVCRLWASILANSLNRCVLTDLEDINYPGRDTRILKGVERLQIALDEGCFCLFTSEVQQCFYSQAITPTSTGMSQSWWRDLQNQTTKKFLNQVRIFVAVDWEAHTKSILGLMPQLRALGIYFSRVRGPTDPLSILPRKSCITHLSLQSLTWDDFSIYFTKGYCSLHRLRYLDVEFTSIRRSTEFTDTRPKPEYSAFQLESLIIRGTLSVPKEDLDPFLPLWGKDVRDAEDGGGTAKEDTIR